jgi:hypothetical protein
MKKLIVIAAMIAAFGLGGAAAFAASTDKPPSPPGQEECGHGNTGKPCKEDPQPDKGKDCEAHGNQGGVNEDHCKEETTPTETTPTTPTETTPTTPTETTPTTPTETTPTTSSQTTPTGTTATETTPSETTVADPEEEEQQQQVFTPPTQQSKGAQSEAVSQVEASGSAARPTQAAQPAPFTP